MSIHERDLLIQGRRVHYLDSGAPASPACTRAGTHVGSESGAGERSDNGRGAPPFVLLHGLGGCSRHWLAVAPALAGHRRVIALDLPGFGASEIAVGPVSLDWFANVVAEFVGLLELGPVVLVGHSFTGPVALRFAAHHPELAAGVALASGVVLQFSALLGVHGIPRSLRARPLETLAIFTEILSAGIPLPTTVRRAIASSGALRRLALWPYVRDPAALSVRAATLLLDGAGARGVFATARAIGGSRPLDGVDAVRCPLLSLAGANDLIVPLADTHEFQRAVPRARTVVFERCGHMMMLERPQAFAKQLLVFASELNMPTRLKTGASP